MQFAGVMQTQWGLFPLIKCETCGEIVEAKYIEAHAKEKHFDENNSQKSDKDDLFQNSNAVISVFFIFASFGGLLIYLATILITETVLKL